MMRMLTLLSALAAIASVGTAAAQPRPSTVITNPDWLQLPSGDDMADHYPQIAQYIYMGGRATISCTVSTLGKLQDCTVVSEDPPDLGFGRAALAMSDLFRMRPMTVQGQPVAGGTVRIPIRFKLPDPEPTGALPKAPNRGRLATALKLVDVLGIEAAIEAQYEESARNIEFIFDEPVPDATRTAAAEALRAAVKGRAAAMREAYAHAYGAQFTEAELDGALAFFQGPAAPVLKSDANLLALQEMVGRDFQRRLVVEARAEFCQRRSCDALPTSTAGAPKDVIESPVWVEEPSGAALMRATPTLARMFALGGYARLSCQVTAQGLLQPCKVVDESPAGLGFGQAALSLAGGFRLAPALVPLTAGGKTVAARLAFPSGELPPAWEPPTPCSPRALQLAKQLLEVSNSLANVEAVTMQGLIEGVGRPPPGSDSATTTAAMEALQFAAKRAMEHFVEQGAAVLASQFTEEQLAAAVAFRASPAGRALLEKDLDLSESLAKAAAAYGELIGQDARANYCKARPCPATPPKPAG